MSRFRCEYVYSKPFGTARHDWRLIGAKGGINLHISGPYKHTGAEHWTAGLEMHSRLPPDYMRDQAPSHDHCWLLKCPCWHDGTSLYAQEHYLPQWMSDMHAHDRMFADLEREYLLRFEGDAS